VTRKDARRSAVVVGIVGLPGLALAEPRISTTATRLTHVVPWQAWYAGVVGISLIAVPGVIVVRLRQAGVSRGLTAACSLAAGMLAALVGAGVLQFIVLGSVGYMDLSPWPLLGAWAASAALLCRAGVRTGLWLNRATRARRR